MKASNSDYFKLAKRLEKKEPVISGRKISTIQRKLRNIRESELFSMDYSFPYVSQYSHMRLLSSAKYKNVNIVEKIYGMQTGNLGYSMEMTSGQAHQIATHIRNYYKQLITIGLNVANLVSLEVVPLENSYWGIKLRQEFIQGYNFMDVYRQSVIDQDLKLGQKLLLAMLKIIHTSTSYRTTNTKLFPYCPDSVFDSHLGIDAKPQNFIINTETKQEHVILVDIVYPSNRIKDGTFSYIAVMPSVEKKYLGWQYLPLRVANKFGLYCKMILELAGGCSDITNSLSLLRIIESQTLNFIFQHEPRVVYNAIEREIKDCYSTFRSMQCRGEEARFNKIWSLLDKNAPCRIQNSLDISTHLKTIFHQQSGPVFVH